MLCDLPSGETIPPTDISKHEAQHSGTSPWSEFIRTFKCIRFFLKKPPMLDTQEMHSYHCISQTRHQKHLNSVFREATACHLLFFSSRVWKMRPTEHGLQFGSYMNTFISKEAWQYVITLTFSLYMPEFWWCGQGICGLSMESSKGYLNNWLLHGLIVPDLVRTWGTLERP